MAYVTVADLKTYLGTSGSGDDTLLATLISAATAIINAETGRHFEAETETRYYQPDAIDADDPSLLHLDGDLVSVTTLKNGEDETIPSTDYWLLPRNSGPPYHSIKLKTNSTDAWTFDTDGEISVAGAWGWSATPPADIVMACKRLAGYLYKLKDSQVFDVTALPDQGAIMIPKGMPQDVKVILAKYRKLL